MDSKDINAVHAFFNDYHRKVKTREMLYAYAENTQLTVVLPASLLHYADAASGHSGYGAGARLVGIRYSNLSNARAVRDRNFATIENLIRFIETSPADARRDILGDNYSNTSAPIIDEAEEPIEEIMEVNRLFEIYSSRIKPRFRADFRLDLYDVATGKCNIEDLLSDYD